MTDNEIHIKDFNKDKVTFTLPEEVRGAKSSFTRSAVGYGDYTPPLHPDEGRPYLLDEQYLYFITGWLDCIGIYPTYEQGVTRTPDNVTGYQAIIPLTTKETVKNPTESEQLNIDFFQSLPDKLAEFMNDNKELMPDSYQDVPDNKMRSRITNIVSRKWMNETYEVKTKGGKIVERTRKVEDPATALTLFLPLQYTKSGKFRTHIYGPGNREVDPRKYHKKPGRIQMVIQMQHINYGKNASFKMRLMEANYKPSSFAPQRRRLGANDAPVEADIPDTPQTNTVEKDLDVEDTYDPNQSEPTPQEEPEQEEQQTPAPKPKFEYYEKDGKRFRRKIK